MRKMVPLLLILAVFATVPCLGEEQSVEQKVERPVRQAVDLRKQVRREETTWQDQRGRLLAQVEQLQQEQADLTARRTRLLDEKNATQARITKKTNQLDRIDQIAEQIDPFLHELLTRLNRLVAEDLPFLADERQRRLSNLAGMLEDPEVTQSERLRKLMEALMVELEYGQTIEATRETIDINGEPTLVDVFRLGRLALFYQHLNGEACGFFNIAENQWQPLSDKYQEAILAAMEIGAKRRPVELLSLPIGKIEAPAIGTP